MTRQLVVIGCGAAKLDHAAPAADLYVGSYFRLALSAALQLADADDVVVLSAKHGLLGLGDVAAPYDLTMGQPGAVGSWPVTRQAAARQLLGRPVIALCSRRYAALLQLVWDDVATPLAGLGIGYQRQVLAAIRDGRHSLTFGGTAR